MKPPLPSPPPPQTDLTGFDILCLFPEYKLPPLLNFICCKTRLIQCETDIVVLWQTKCIETGPRQMNMSPIWDISMTKYDVFCISNNCTRMDERYSPPNTVSCRQCSSPRENTNFGVFSNVLSRSHYFDDIHNSVS